MEKNNFYVCILAGGSGTRLWPLSNDRLPKQLLPIHKKKTLLDATIQRACKLTSKDNIYIITTKQWATAIKNHTKNIYHILIEPDQKNTGPAIIYTTMKLYTINKHAHILFLPADHGIKNIQAFCNDISLLQKYTQNAITLCGIKPLYPSTAYGYIAYNNKSKPLYTVKTFIEKPSHVNACTYIKKTNILWNSGIVYAKAITILSECKAHAPNIYQQIKRSQKQKIYYNTIAPISFDHMILQKSILCKVLKASFDWKDIGNLYTFLLHTNKHQDNLKEIATYQSKDNAIQSSKKKIILIGVQDLCIIETKDILLIAHKNCVDAITHIKKTATTLAKSNRKTTSTIQI